MTKALRNSTVTHTGTRWTKKIDYASSYDNIVGNTSNSCKAWDSLRMHTFTSELVTLNTFMKRNKQF